MTEKEVTQNTNEMIILDYVTKDIAIVKERDTARALIKAIASEHNLPVYGLTILGGRPYVNVTGLDSKLQLDERKVKRVDYEMIQRAVPENDYLAGYVGIVEFEDTPERMKLRAEVITEALKQNKSFEEIKRIVEASGLTAPIYRDEGWCSPATAPAICYNYIYDKQSQRKIADKEHPLIENVNMMALRKATNRAKRHAVGCGLTSVEEMGQLSTELKKESVNAEFVETDKTLEPEPQGELPLR